MVLHAGIIYFFIVIFCVVAIVLTILYRRPSVKGRRGENRVSATLKYLPSESRMIDNLVLKTKDGYTQLDHVVVSHYGLFVIETKNYKGWIFGSETKLHWKQVLYKQSYQFYNPIFQNQSHIRVLRSHLPDLYRLPMVSIVVFAGDCKLKIHAPNEHVIKRRELNSIIKNYSEKNLDNAEIENIYNRLFALDKSQEYSPAEHKKQIEQNIQQTQQKIYTGVCPRCGGTLIERKGKYGKFYGCSNYPKCRFIHK